MVHAGVYAVSRGAFELIVLNTGFVGECGNDVIPLRSRLTAHAALERPFSGGAAVGGGDDLVVRILRGVGVGVRCLLLNRLGFGGSALGAGVGLYALSGAGRLGGDFAGVPPVVAHIGVGTFGAVHGVLVIVQRLVGEGVVAAAFKAILLQPLRAVLADIERAVGAECAPFQFPPLTEAAGQVGKRGGEPGNSVYHHAEGFLRHLCSVAAQPVGKGVAGKQAFIQCDGQHRSGGKFGARVHGHAVLL